MWRVRSGNEIKWKCWMFFLKKEKILLLFCNRGTIEKPYSLGLQKYITIWPTYSTPAPGMCTTSGHWIFGAKIFGILGYHGFQIFTLSDKLVVLNGRQRVDFKQQILALLLSHNSQLVSHKICSHFAISWGFVYLVEQSRSLPHEAFHDDKTNLKSSFKKTGATIGYNVSVANNNLCLPRRKKKEIRPNF